MSTNSTNSRWTWKEWTRAIIAGIASWFVISYLIQPAVSRTLSGTSALIKWVSDATIARSIVYAKGGVEYALLVIISVLLGAMVGSIVLILIRISYRVALFFWRHRSGRSPSEKSLMHRLLGDPTPGKKLVIALPIIWVSGVVLLILIIQSLLPMTLGMSMRIGFENAMARLAPNISQEEALTLRSKWWGMHGRQDYELLAKDVNRLAMERGVFIGNALSAEYNAIVDPKVQDK